MHSLEPYLRREQTKKIELRSVWLLLLCRYGIFEWPSCVVQIECIYWCMMKRLFLVIGRHEGKPNLTTVCDRRTLFDSRKLVSPCSAWFLCYLWMSFELGSQERLEWANAIFHLEKSLISPFILFLTPELLRCTVEWLKWTANADIDFHRTTRKPHNAQQ